MPDQTGSAAFNFTNFSGSGEHVGQLIAAITVAIKGKLCMFAPCPRCEGTKRLFEKVLPDNSIRHECKSCGYIQYWKPRVTIDAQIRRLWLEQGQRQVTGRVHTD